MPDRAMSSFKVRRVGAGKPAGVHDVDKTKPEETQIGWQVPESDASSAPPQPLQPPLPEGAISPASVMPTVISFAWTVDIVIPMPSKSPSRHTTVRRDVHFIMTSGIWLLGIGYTSCTAKLRT